MPLKVVADHRKQLEHTNAGFGSDATALPCCSAAAQMMPCHNLSSRRGCLTNYGIIIFMGSPDGLW